MNAFQKALIAAALVAITLLLAGCPPRVSIRDINRNPARYANREISVGGRVSNSFGAMGSGVFEIDDGTGTIWIYSAGNGVPSSGTKVGVSGHISQGFTIGGRSFAVILHESKRRR